MKNKTIVCRCEDVSLEQIHEYLNKGYTSIEDLKRLLRVGMGPCQGNTCIHLIQREISNYLNVPIAEVKTHKIRPMTAGVQLKKIAEDAHEK
jgi:bacterioferritin-associated ferredoxin